MADDIVGILLAAGAGRRFGSDKLRHRLPDGRPLALAAAQSLLTACPQVVAVVRPGADELAGMLAEAGCQVVISPIAEAGMGHSLAAGVRAAAAAGGWLVALADMPFIAPASHRAVVAAMQDGARLAASQYEGRRGHPVGFGREWFAALSKLRGDHGARAILEQHGQLLRLCPVDDPGVLCDVDRPEQLAASPGQT